MQTAKVIDIADYKRRRLAAFFILGWLLANQTDDFDAFNLGGAA